MTCIVAMVGDGKVHMAGDKMGSNGFSRKEYSKPKVFINDGFIFGYTDSYRMGQLLEHHWTPPVRPEGVSDDKYLYKIVVDSFIKLFQDNHFGRKDGVEVESGEFLFGWKGRLFRHQGCHSILEYDNFASVGSGCYHAEAALSTMLGMGVSCGTEELLSKCIKVASAFIPSVSSSYTYKVLEAS